MTLSKYQERDARAARTHSLTAMGMTGCIIIALILIAIGFKDELFVR